jgi:hypothetical protein
MQPQLSTLTNGSNNDGISAIVTSLPFINEWQLVVLAWRKKNVQMQYK